jgi:hypothetical protein
LLRCGIVSHVRRNLDNSLIHGIISRIAAGDCGVSDRVPDFNGERLRHDSTEAIVLIGREPAPAGRPRA